MGMPMIDRVFRVPALMALAALSAGCAAAQDDSASTPEAPKKLVRQLRPEAVAPENSLLYIATPDVKRARTALERTAFRAIMSEEEVWAPIATAFSKLRDVYVKGDGTRSEAQMKL